MSERMIDGPNFNSRLENDLESSRIHAEERRQKERERVARLQQETSERLAKVSARNHEALQGKKVTKSDIPEVQKQQKVEKYIPPMDEEREDKIIGPNGDLIFLPDKKNY